MQPFLFLRRHPVDARGKDRLHRRRQYAAAKAEALIESSALNVKEAFRSLWAKVVACEPVPIEMRAPFDLATFTKQIS